jgi:flagellar hook-length control protein FliK
VSQPDILAIFTPQAPVEQAVSPPKNDGVEDNGFQRIMDDENHKVSPVKENNKAATDRQGHSSRQDHSSSSKPSDNKSIEKSKPTQGKKTDQTASKEIDQNTPQEPLNNTKPNATDSETISPQELASVENLQEAMDQLKELGFNVQAVDTLLEIFKNDSGMDVGSLLQSLTAQNSKLQDFSLQDFLAANSLDENSFSQLENRKSLINDLLKQVGFNEQESKNLVQKIESKQINTSNLNDQLTKKDFSTIDKAVKPEVVSQANKDTVDIQTDGKKNKDNDQSDKDLNLKTQVKTADKETTVKKSEIQSRLSPDVNKKLDDTGSTEDEKISSNENVKSVSKNTGQEKNISQNTIGMKYADGSLDAAKSKSLEAIKANGEVNVQNNNVAGGGNNKSESALKTVLPENSIYKAPIESRVIDQIINRLSVRSNNSQSEVKIQLDPPSLGRVRMSIITSGDGVRTIIVAENQAVKQVIENNLSQLRDSMSSQGLKLDGFSVLVGGDSNPEFSQKQDSFAQSNTDDFDLIDTKDWEGESIKESSRQTSFIFDDISQTISVVA